MDGVAVRERARSAHPLVGGGADRRAGDERPLPGDEIQHARPERAGGVGAGHAQRVVVAEAAPVPDLVALGAAGDDGVVFEVVGPRQSERREEALFEETPVGDAREAFDEDPEQVVAGVVVLVALAGFELEGLRGEQLHHRLVAEVETGPFPELLDLGVPLDARGVVQQPLHRDREPAGVVVREDFAQLGVEIQLALRGEQHRGGGGELLRHRADPVHGVLRRRDAVFEVRFAEPPGEEQLSAPFDGDGDSRSGMAPQRVLDEREDPAGEGMVRRTGGVFRRGSGAAGAEGEDAGAEGRDREQPEDPAECGGHGRR